MHAATPSRTALAVAIRRGLHQLVDQPPVFADPLAVRILPKDAAATLDLSDPLHTERFHLSLRAFVAVRSRFAEDTLALAHAAGTNQYVLLGAGLDTFSYRNPYASLHTFEVDHPATQSWKRQLHADAAISIPANHTFAPCHFEQDRLPDALRAAGFDPTAPAFFSWLGVVPYLTPAAFAATLRYLASLPRAAVVFDYALPREVLPPLERLALDALSARVAKAGEPFQLFMTPDSLAAQAHAAGFPHCTSLNTTALNAHYFTNRSDNLRIHGTAPHLAHLHHHLPGPA